VNFYEVCGGLALSLKQARLLGDAFERPKTEPGVTDSQVLSGLRFFVIPSSGFNQSNFLHRVCCFLLISF
jgi:hypothetical protein